MSLLKQIKTDDSIQTEKDSVGGGGLLNSGVYNFTIQNAYVIKADSEAIGVVVNLETEDKKRLKQTFWITSGKAKGGLNTYTDKKGETHYLPGFVMANALTLLTVGQEINELDTESKTISIYNYEAKGEVPTKVDMIMDLVGKQITAGVIKQTVDKTAKNDAGAYAPTGETREENEIDKFFRTSDKMTTAEIRAKAETATFVTTWTEKWTDKVKDKTSKVAGTAGAPKAAGAGASTPKPKQSLFG